MKTETTYQCEKCEEYFDTEVNCIDHEKTCSTKESRWCFKCGNAEEWDKNYDWSSAYEERWYHIDLGRPGYGSSLDGCNVRFDLCDSCLRDIIGSFTLEGQEKIENSGSNQYLPTDIWLRHARGELTDEEHEEYGMYSPRQINAYDERFPCCDKVFIVEYNDGSRGSQCPRKAFGEKDGTASQYNKSTECFGCELFNKRPDGGEIPVVYRK